MSKQDTTPGGTTTPGGQSRSVKGKRVLITGGTTGIGRATARLLAEDGARVVIFGRHEPELRAALDELLRVGEVSGLTADQAKLEDVRRVFQHADRELGGLDILIANAGISIPGMSEGKPEDWQYGVNANLMGYIYCTHEALQRFRRNTGGGQGADGHIVFVGSMSADLREAGHEVYVATKAAIQGYSEALRKQVNEEGVKVSLVEPGLVATEMSDSPQDQKQQKQEAMRALKSEDIAEAIHFCVTRAKRCDVVKMEVRPHLQTI